MDLKEYKKKRNFTTTTEPDARPKHQHGGLPIFVIQRHDARVLHFDLRLEHRGVLLSWAITKKPVLNKNIKRLAIHVEDHPFEYKDFSGLIPKDNYGAGIVELWDEGIFYLEDATSRDEIEKELDDKMNKGHFVFYLKGRRLEGKFVLVKLGNEKNDWLFYYDNIDKEEADEADDQHHTTYEGFVYPMLPTLTNEPFDGKEWLFEPKLDGYRAIAMCDSREAKLLSRNGEDLGSKFPQILAELKDIKEKIILDGEIVSLDQKGKPDFSLMRSVSSGNVFFYLFDILHWKRTGLMNFPLSKRKEILNDALQDSAHVKKLVYTTQSGKSFYESVIAMGFEGMVAKRLDSSYQSGRTRDWYKVKEDKTLDLAVIGYLPDDKGGFKSLMVGEPKQGEEGSFVYRGNVGSGWSAKDVREISERLVESNVPFAIEGLNGNHAGVLVKPNLIIEVGYLEVTDDGKLRHPVFKKVRDDK